LARTILNKNFAFLAVSLLAFDPMYFSFGRIMNLDTISHFFNLASLYLLIKYFQSKQQKFIYGGAFLLGLSLAVKLSVIFLVIFLPFLLVVLGDFRKRRIAEVTVSILKFYFFVALGFVLGNSIYFFINHFGVSFITYSIDLVSSQITMQKFEEGYLYSSTISWFTVPQILTLYRIDFGKNVESILAFQNPIMFMTTFVSIIWTAVALLSKKLENSKVWILVLFWFFLQYVPYLFNIHTTYYYYIITLLPIIILIFINLTNSLKYSNLIFRIAFAISLFIFILYYPLLIGLKVPKKYELTLFKYSLYNYPAKDSIFCQNCSPRK